MIQLLVPFSVLSLSKKCVSFHKRVNFNPLLFKKQGTDRIIVKEINRWIKLSNNEMCA